MSNPSFPPRRHGALALGFAVVLLHWLALGWLGGQFGPTRPRAYQPDETVFAQLVTPEPQPATAPPQPQPLPVRLRPPPPPPPLALPDLADEAPPAMPDAASEAPAEAVARGPGVEGAQGSAGDAPAVAQAAEPPAPEPAPPAAPEPRRYKVDLPPSADITLDVARTDADGTNWSGEAVLSWKLAGGSYRIKVEAGIRVVFARVNLVVLTSEGALADTGFEPVTMTEKRRGRSLTATHFNRQDGTITFSASQKSYPLALGAQDKASVPLQLAAIARADPGQLSGDIDILVGEDKDASVFRFHALGQEEIDTRMGRILAWHLSRPPKPGSYNSRLDIWLAPGHGWYPVRIRNIESSGAVTTQTVNNIVMTDTGT